MTAENDTTVPSMLSTDISPEEKALRTIISQETRPLFLSRLRDSKGDPFYLIGSYFPEDDLNRWFDSITADQFPTVTDFETQVPWLPVDALFEDVDPSERHKLFSRFVRRFEYVIITYIKSGIDNNRLVPVTAPVFKALLCLGLNLPEEPSASNFTHGMREILQRLFELQVGRYVEKDRKLKAGEMPTEKELQLPDLKPGELEERSDLLMKLKDISFKISTQTKEKLQLIVSEAQRNAGQ